MKNLGELRSTAKDGQSIMEERVYDFTIEKQSVSEIFENKPKKII